MKTNLIIEDKRPSNPSVAFAALPDQCYFLRDGYGLCIKAPNSKRVAFCLELTELITVPSDEIVIHISEVHIQYYK